MRGHCLPTSFLVLAGVAGLWLLAGSFGQRTVPEWQLAGLGGPRQVAESWPSIGWNLAVAAPPVAAQGVSKDRSEADDQELPKFWRIVIRPGFRSSFEGTGRPGQRVDVILDGTAVASIKVGADGRWRASTSLLGAGDYRVSVATRGQRGNSVIVGQNVRIAIPKQAATSEIVAYDQAIVEKEVETRAHAERLAEAASEEFDDFARRQLADERDQKSELAQNVEVGEDKAVTEAPPSSSAYGRVEDWFKKSSEDYYGYVVPELARRGEDRLPARVEDVPLPEPSSRRTVEQTAGPSLSQRAQDWLRDANRNYQDTIVRNLSGDVKQPAQIDGGDQQIASNRMERDGGSLLEADVGQTTADGDERQAEAVQAEAGRRAAAAEEERVRAEEAQRQVEAATKKRLAEQLARRQAQFAQAEAERRAAAAEQERAQAEEAQRQAEAARQKQLEEDLARRQAQFAQAEAARRAAAAEQERVRAGKAQRQAEAARKKQLEEDLARRTKAQNLLVERRARQRSLEIAKKAARAERIDQLANKARESRQSSTDDLDERHSTEPQQAETRSRVLARKSQRAEEVARLSDELRLVEPSGSETARSTNVPLPETSQLRRERYDVWAKGSPGDRLEADDTRTRVEPPARRGRSAGWRIRRSRHGTGCRDPRAGRTIRLPGTYVVARGDTLWHISRRHYRRGYRYGRIYRANRRKIRDPHWIYPCQKFWLPRTRWRR